MRILVGSPAFLPSLGGLERFVEQLANGLADSGDQVVVMTTTPASEPDRFSFRVVRRPGPVEKIRLLRECEVFFQANVSLRDLWPLAFVRRPWVVSHHGLYGGRGLVAISSKLKMLLARRASSAVSVSRFVAGRVDPDSEVVPIPYRDDLFRELEGVGRARAVLFFGRLVSDKGCQLLLTALARLLEAGHAPATTIVGEGPDAASLANLAGRLGLGACVRFLGRKDGEELVRTLNEHLVLAVPSVVEEGFGLAAIEGLACGCRVVAADAGGLPEALGGCGWLFRSGDPGDLARALDAALSTAAHVASRDQIARHLTSHRGAPAVARYRAILARAGGFVA